MKGQQNIPERWKSQLPEVLETDWKGEHPLEIIHQKAKGRMRHRSETLKPIKQVEGKTGGREVTG